MRWVIFQREKQSNKVKVTLIRQGMNGDFP